jgi:hypothetical protein
MHGRETVAEALRLAADGLNNCEIARRTGVSRPTIRDWINGRLPHSYRRCSQDESYVRGGCSRCGADEHRFDRLDADYVQLLGLYLGDGSIAEHRRKVYKLRITLDIRYPGIVEECERAIRQVVHTTKCADSYVGAIATRFTRTRKPGPVFSLSMGLGKSTTDRSICLIGRKRSQNAGRSNCSED